MTLAYYFVMLYIRYELSRILEKHCFNSIGIFCRIIIRVCASWCSTFARCAIVWANGGAISETAGKTADNPAHKITSEVASGVIGIVANSADYKADSKAASRIICRTINRVAGRIGTIRVWINIPIIIMNLLAYVSKFKKWSK